MKLYNSEKEDKIRNEEEDKPFLFIPCKYRTPNKCNHPRVKDIPSFGLVEDEDCGDCLYRE